MKNYNAKIVFCHPIMVILFTAFLAVGVNAQAGNGWLSRYWDGCKPSCSWSGKQYNGQGQCKECDKNNNKINTNDLNRSSCEGGTSYTCWDMAPWAVDNTTAYGFAAAHNDGQCGTCWQLTFDGRTGNNSPNTNASSLNGKKLTVMISNIGGDVQGNQLDFLVPGGGVGNYDSFSSQIGNSNLGQRYGGLVSDGCIGNPSCLRRKCDNAFGNAGQEWLKAGCYFYADWMGAVDNPSYNAISVSCPAALVDRWKNTATMYTLTVNRNPAAGGTTTPESSQSNIIGGTQVNISAAAATGYTFNNWTVSGSGTIAGASNTSTSVTVNGNVTVTANFEQNKVNPINLPQIASGNLRAQATASAIVLENLPSNAKIEIYNLQGKRIYSNHSENSQILKILVQTKGMYIIKVKFSGETKSLRIPVI